MERTKETLLRRDIPIPPGRRIRFQFAIEFDMQLDGEILEEGEQLTLEELEVWLAGAGKHPTTDDLWSGLRRSHGLSVMDHGVYLTDVAGEDGEIRFERPWEQTLRANPGVLAGRYEWLDAIPPAANGGAS